MCFYHSLVIQRQIKHSLLNSNPTVFLLQYMYIVFVCKLNSFRNKLEFIIETIHFIKYFIYSWENFRITLILFRLSIKVLTKKCFVQDRILRGWESSKKRVGCYNPGLLSGVTGKDVARWELGFERGGFFYPRRHSF
mgnify:CR=1 FL=1